MGHIRSDEFFGMTMPAAVRKFLEIKKAPHTVADITKGIEEGGYTTTAKSLYALVSTAIRRMSKKGEAVQLSGKKWGLAVWYPTQPKPSMEKKKGVGDENAEADETSKPSEEGPSKED